MANTLDTPKDELILQSQQKMEQFLSLPQWSTREKLALSCRILFDAGHDSGLAGQITARAGEPGTYYTQQLGLGFDEITASNLLLVDEDLNRLDGAGMPNPANRFHTWVYRRYPDIQCIIHTHPFHVATLSMLEKPLVIVLTIGSKGIPLGDYKQGDNVEMDTDFECYYMKQTFDNKDIVEFDPLNNLYVVDGVDQLAQYRKNLGL